MSSIRPTYTVQSVAGIPQIRHKTQNPERPYRTDRIQPPDKSNPARKPQDQYDNIGRQIDVKA